MYRVYQPSMSKPYKRYNQHAKMALNIGAVVAAVLLVSACTLTSQNKPEMATDQIVTGSMENSTGSARIENTDAEVIKTTVVDADNHIPKTSELAWSNPETGNSGTIMAIDKFIGTSGQKCKKFQTTLDSFMGISLYDGETCEVKRGLWVMSQFMRR